MLFFQKKLDRSMELAREKSEKDFSTEPEELPSMEDLKAEMQSDKPELEKGDLPAMLMAGFITILPACILVLLLICAVVFLFL